MDRLHAHAKQPAETGRTAGAGRRLQCHSHPLDAKIPEAWMGDALFLPETRAKFRRS